MEIIAHRGLSKEAPENSLAAVEKALALRISAIEIDCRMTADGKVIVFHNDTLEQAQQVNASVINHLHYDQLRKIDIGNGQHMPLLEEVLDMVAGTAPLMLESKVTGTAAAIMQLLDRTGYHGNIHITSSFVTELLHARAHTHGIPVSLVVRQPETDLDEIFRFYGIREFSIDRHICSYGWVRSARSQGYTVRVFTVNDPQEKEQFESWDVQGIFTDNPRIFLQPAIVV